MLVYQCKKCGGAGTVEFTKEFGGPVCNNCWGNGYITKLKLRGDIAAMLDHPSVYMGGPSKGNLKRADKILEYLADEGIEFPEGENCLAKKQEG